MFTLRLPRFGAADGPAVPVAPDATPAGTPYPPLPEGGAPPLVIRDDVIVATAVAGDAEGTFTALFALTPRALGPSLEVSPDFDPERVAFGVAHVLNAVPDGGRLAIYRAATGDLAPLLDAQHAAVAGGHPLAARLARELSVAASTAPEPNHVPLLDGLFVAYTYQPRVRPAHRGTGVPCRPVPAGALAAPGVHGAYRKARAAFESGLHRVVIALEHAGFRPHRLTTAALTDHVATWYGVDGAPDGDRKGGAGAGDLVVDAWGMGRGWCRVGARDVRYVAAFRAAVVPRDVAANADRPTRAERARGLAKAAARLPAAGALVIEAVAMTKQSEVDRLREAAKQTPSDTERHTPGPAGEPTDPERERRAREWLLDWRTDEQIFGARAVLFVEAPTPAALERACELTESVFLAQGVELSRTMDGRAVAEARQQAAPWAVVERRHPERVWTSMLAAAAPVAAPTADAAGRPTLLVRTLQNRVACVDPTHPDLNDYRALIHGGVGSGTTLAACALYALPFLARPNTEVVVVTRGAAYDPLAAAVDGEVVRWAREAEDTGGPTALPALRPLTVPEDLWTRGTDAREEVVVDVIAVGIEIVLAAAGEVVADPGSAGRRVGEVAAVAVSAAVSEAVAAGRQPRLGAVHTHLSARAGGREEGAAEAQALANALAPFVTTANGVAGRYAAWLDGEEEVGTPVAREARARPVAPMTVFDLGWALGVPDEQARAVLAVAVVGGALGGRLRRVDGVARLFIMDEMDDLLAAPGGRPAGVTPEVSPLTRGIWRVWQEARMRGASVVAVAHTLDAYAARGSYAGVRHLASTVVHCRRHTTEEVRRVYADAGWAKGGATVGLLLYRRGVGNLVVMERVTARGPEYTPLVLPDDGEFGWLARAEEFPPARDAVERVRRALAGEEGVTDAGICAFLAREAPRWPAEGTLPDTASAADAVWIRAWQAAARND